VSKLSEFPEGRLCGNLDEMRNPQSVSSFQKQELELSPEDKELHNPMVIVE
jgi:hypothetical protein